ncbi:hypothetical protein HAX54_050745 [Datura stramonium]|uniref:Uncharacterized protein n=1 Tax=Datura stramonium TaxID=4076 RepID=A0ABS8SWT6_DATST|nr:hypothetical protein [Datura stramonium]
MEAENAYTLPSMILCIDSPMIGMENLDFPAKSLNIPACVENEISHLTNECEEVVLTVAMKSAMSGGQKNLFKYMDSARSTTDFEKTNQQKQFSEINGRISPQIDNISVNTKPRVEEDRCQAAEITKDEIFEMETEALIGYGVDGDKDFPLHSCNIELPKLSKTESEVPGELSKPAFLDLVDTTYQFYNEDASNEVKAGGMNRIVSPPIFNRVGPQRLASRMNVQNAVKNSGVFDWLERQSDGANGSFQDTKDIDLPQKNYHRRSKNYQVSNPEPMDGMIDLNKAEPKFLAEDHMNVESNFLRKSDEQFDMGDFQQQVDNDEMMNLRKERAISREFNIDDSSSEPTECSSADTELLRGKTRGFSSLVHRTRHQVSLNLRSLENPTTNSITESNFPKKRRKQHELGELNDNLFKVAAVREKVSKSGINTSKKARKVSMNKRGEIHQSVAATLSQVKWENWVSKGKRTHKGVRRLSNGSSNLYPLLLPADQGNDFKFPVLNHKAERRRQSLELKRQNQSSSEKTQSGLMSILQNSKTYSSMCKYSVTSQKMTPMDFKRVESTESAELNEMPSISTNLLTEDMKSDVMSIGISDPSYCLSDHKKGKQHMRDLS